MVTKINVTWYVNGTGPGAPLRNTTVLVGPGQDILADVPKIIAVASWSDNSLAHRVTVTALKVSGE